MNCFYRAANIRGSQKGLPDQHCLRIGGQAGTGSGELVKLASRQVRWWSSNNPVLWYSPSELNQAPMVKKKDYRSGNPFDFI